MLDVVLDALAPGEDDLGAASGSCRRRSSGSPRSSCDSLWITTKRSRAGQADGDEEAFVGLLVDRASSAAGAWPRRWRQTWIGTHGVVGRT